LDFVKRKVESILGFGEGIGIRLGFIALRRWKWLWG